MRQALPVPQRVMAVVLSVLFVFCPFAAHAAGESDTAADPVLLPIIMYHEVKPNKSGKDAIQPWEFEADLKWLADNGYTTIVMADLIAYVRDGTPLPEKPIILSFDDGYYNNYVYVLPLLQQYSARIVLSLLGRNTDDFTEWPSESIDYAHVTWDQLNEMLDTGLVEVQNHSYNLHAYTCLLYTYPSGTAACRTGASRTRPTRSCCAQTSSACRMNSPSTPAARRTRLPIPTASTAT